MKKHSLKYTAGLLVLFGAASLQSCDKNFKEINTNPDATPVAYPPYVFTKAEYDGIDREMTFFMGTMQYTTSYNDVAGWGSKYNAAQTPQTFAAFTGAYPNE